MKKIDKSMLLLITVTLVTLSMLAFEVYRHFLDVSSTMEKYNHFLIEQTQFN